MPTRILTRTLIPNLWTTGGISHVSVHLMTSHNIYRIQTGSFKVVLDSYSNDVDEMCYII